MNIIKPSTPMYLEPNEKSVIETECLFGENIKIIKKKSDWYFCQLLTDTYCGWLRSKHLGILPKSTHKIISIRSFLFTRKNIKSSIMHYLPFGSKIHVKKIEGDWAKILLSKSHKAKVGYILKKDIISISAKIKDWVRIAEQFIDIPYKWGGRDTMGIDCSALLQLSYQAIGKNIPRNTIDQIKLDKRNITDLEDLDRGFAVFWEGHVGIMTDKSNCIHANAYHMKTVIEPLKNIISRMGTKYPVIKILDMS